VIRQNVSKELTASIYRAGQEEQSS
jgi:hypothetical protein